MREILFKAKRKNWKELPKEQWWVKGYLWNGNDHSYIIPYNFGIGYDSDTNSLRATSYEIDKDTICQYTGLTDKNGNKIWENDVVEEDWGNYKGVVRFGEFGSVVLKNIGFNIEWLKNLAYRQDILYWADKSVVIGNVFDNPDLLQ